MKLLLVGGGAREHALAWKLSGEQTVRELVCGPGNAGIARLARCVALDVSDPEAILAAAVREQVDFTVVGPELPLAGGVADVFAAAGRPLFGPRKAAARLESSKVFAKRFMERHAIPTARFRVCDTPPAALAAVTGDEFGFPVVVKADGLAAGKGVTVAPDRETAEAAVRAAMVDGRFGAAGSSVVIEECLAGDEASFFVLCDGRRGVALPSAQDHKRAFDGDQGPNTGGMGAFAPSPLVSQALARPRDDGDRPAGARRTPVGRHRVPRGALRRSDADARRAPGDRVQCALRRPGSAGRTADDRNGPRRPPCSRRPPGIWERPPGARLATRTSE